MVLCASLLRVPYAYSTQPKHNNKKMKNKLKKEFRRSRNPSLETCCESYVYRLSRLAENGVEIYENTEEDDKKINYKQLEMFKI